MPKYAGKVRTVLNKAIKVFPSFTGFTTPIMHTCFCKPEVHSTGLDYKDKTLLNIWYYGFDLAQRSQEQSSSWGWTQHSQSREQEVGDKLRCSTHQHNALHPAYSRERVLYLHQWNFTMTWEPISLSFNLKQCRWGFSLAGPRCYKPVPYFSPDSCAFWCLSGQPLSPKICCRNKKVIKLQGETGSFSERFCSLSHSLWMSLYLLFAEQEMHY